MSVKNVNSFLIGFSFFQFGILLPIVALMGSQLIVVASSFLILAVLLVINKFKIKKYVLVFGIILILNFLVSYLIYQNTNTLLIFIEFIGKSFLVFLFASFDFDGDELEKSFIKLSVLNFFSILIVFALGYVTEIGYMRFGYAILPTVLISLYVLFTKKHALSKKLSWVIVFFTSFILMLLYGNRGTLICMAIFILVGFYSLKIKTSFKLLITSIMGLLIYLVFSKDLLTKIIDFLYYDLSIKTYSLQKFKLAIEEGVLESSSGRDQIYSAILDLFSHNPFWGGGIGITQTEIGFTAHNFFLQVLTETGILGFSVWIVFLGIAFYMMKKIKNLDFKLFSLLLIVFSVSFGRLLISSDIWLRTEWWLFISLLFNTYFMLRKNE